MSSDRRDDRRRGDSRDDHRKSRHHETNKNDAKSIRCRVFVGNLNTDLLTRLEFEEVFSEHGKVVGASIHNGFGFVQYEKESEADLAVMKKHGSLIKDKRVDVNLAGERRKPLGDEKRYGAPPPRGIGRPDGLDRPRGRSPSPPDNRGLPGYRGRDRDLLPLDPYGPPRDGYRRPDDGYPGRYPPPRLGDPLPPKRMKPDYDYPPPATGEVPPYAKPLPDGAPIDCEIVIINRQQRGYADMVEKKLKTHGLLVECAHLPETVTLVSELEDASRRGVLYGIIISSQHEVHHSVTVHILHGTQQEHRNMPLEDAIKLVSRNFDVYMQTLREREREKEKPAAPVEPLGPPKDYGAGDLTPVSTAPLPYSPEVSQLLNMAADGKRLTANQYTELIDELTKLRDDTLRMEGRPLPSAAPTSKPFPTDPQSIALQQAELQAKILSILNPSNKAKLALDSNSQAKSAPVSEAKPAAKIPVLTPSYTASTAFKAPVSTVAAGSPKASGAAAPQYTSNIIGMALSNIRSATGQSATPNQVSSNSSYYPNSTGYPKSYPYVAAPGMPGANSTWSQALYRPSTMASSNSAAKPIPSSISPGYGARMNAGYPTGFPNSYPRY